MTLALLEQLDSDISSNDRNDKDFPVDNVNLQNASSSKISDSDAVGHSANVIHLDIPKSGHSCGHGQTQR